MTRHAITLCLSLALLAGACGPKTLEQDIEALQTSFDGKDYAAVTAGVDPVLERCRAEAAGDNVLWRVEKLRLSALARQGQGAATAAQLERLAPEYPQQVTAKLYAQFGTFVEGAGNDLEAIEIYDAGAKRFPQSTAVFRKQIGALKERATAAGNAEALEKLKSLGYL